MADQQPQSMTVPQAMRLALEHHQAGHLPQAEALYRQVLAAQPNNPDALHLLGVIAMSVGRHDLAIDLIGRAISINPATADYYSNLGQVLAEVDRWTEAVELHRKAVALDPNLAGAHSNLGNALLELRENDQAIASLRRAVELEPGTAHIHHNLAGALYASGHVEQALSEFDKAIQLQPDFVESHNGRGVALQYSLGKLSEAEQSYRAALAIDPRFSKAHYHLALIQLLRGDFENGWNEHEWRFKVKSLRLPRHDFAQPLWDGSDLMGRRIVITYEQGMGDTIHFSRYALLLANRGAHVIVQCQPQLVRLLRSMSDDIQFIAGDDPVPEFDVHCPMMSLPRLCKTRLNSIPDFVPYLHPDPEQSKSWQARIQSDPATLKVGLVWAGQAGYKNDRNRSIDPAKLAPLGNVSGAVFFSLQKDTAARGAPPLELTDYTADLNDFADTAALVNNLDLIISVDTAVAHLAGAMGKPVWTLLPFMPDWRWMLDRQDTPWYPTMRLLRQPSPGDWGSVVTEAARMLAKAIAEK